MLSGRIILCKNYFQITDMVTTFLFKPQSKQPTPNQQLGLSKYRFFSQHTQTTNNAIKKLDWSHISPRTKNNSALHIILNHTNVSFSKPFQGVFYSDPIKNTELAWETANNLKLKPLSFQGKDYYVVPKANSGYAGGFCELGQNYGYTTIITKSNTNKVITAFPSGSTPPLPKNYRFQFFEENACVNDAIISNNEHSGENPCSALN